MKQVRYTDNFRSWLISLRDKKALALIYARIDRLSLGHKGDCKYIAECVYELRLFYGPGYRLYFTETSDTIIIMLIGGDKGSQKKDIQKAIQLAKEV